MGIRVVSGNGNALQNYDEWKNGSAPEIRQPKNDGNISTVKVTSSSVNILQNYDEWKNVSSYVNVDDSYINSFLFDANEFWNTSISQYNEMTYGSAVNREGADDRQQTWRQLSSQARRIRNYILENKDSLNWNKSWEDLLNYTTNFDQTVKDLSADFENKYAYFDQFENENDYNWHEKYQGNDSDTLLKLMDDLEDGDEKTWLQTYADQVYYSELPGLDLDKAQSKVDYLENLLDVYRKNTRFFTNEQGQRWVAEIEATYGGEDGLLQAISREKRRINEATWVQENEAGAQKFGAVPELPDFAEKSGFNPEITDLVYRYINADLGGRIDLEQKYGTYVSEMGYRSFDALSDEEKAIYNYYMNTGDRQSAADYLKYIQGSLNERKGMDLADFEQAPWLRYAYGGVAGLDQFRSGMEGFGDMIAGREGYKSPSAIQYAAAGIREDLADEGKKLPEWMGGGTWGQAAFDTIITSANMAPSILASSVANLILPGAGAWVGGAMMGASAAGSAYQEMIDSGYSVSQARTYGALVGTAELVLDKILGGISDLGSNSSMAAAITRWAGNVDNALINLIGRIGGNALSEGAEEAIQEVFSGWLQSEITKENFYAKPADVIYSGMLGAITGALFESPKAGFDVYQRTSQGRDVIQAEGVKTLTEMGRSSSDKDIQRMAQRTANKPSAYNVGGLLNQVREDVHKQNVSDISKQLAENGMTGRDADQMAEVIARVLEDGSESDIRLLASETDPIVSKTMRQVQMKGTDLYQRMHQLQGAGGKGRTIAQVAAQYGDKANAIKAAYEQGQDVEDFAHAAERVFTHGKEGGNQEMLDQVAPDMSPQQRLSIYKIGRDAAAQEKAAMSRQYTGEAPVVSVLNEDGSVGESVRIEGVTSKEGGQWTYKTSDGQELTEDQLSFSGDHAVLDTVKALDLDAKTASVMISGNNTISQPDAAVAQGIEDAYRYGSHGYSMERLLKDSEAAGILTEEMRQAAYDAGKNKPGKAKAKPSKAKPKTRGTKPGVYFDNGNGQVQAYDLKSTRQLEDTKKAGVQTAVVLQKLGIGTDFYFFESYVKDGKRVYRDEKGVERPAPNGWYDPNDGSIHIDLKAGNGGQGLTLYTMAHELTHFIEQWSQDKYKVLADFLIKNYEKGRSVDDLVHLKQEALSAGRDKPVSYDEAYSEVIADSMEAMLSDGNVLEKLAELKVKDEGLVRKMKAFFDNFVKKIRSIYADLKPESAEGQLVQEMKEQFEQLQQLFAEALADAGENYQSAAEVGMEVDVDTESVAPMVQMSERTWRESDYVQARNEAAREISKAIGVTEDKARSYIDDVNSIAKMIAEDRTRLDYFSSPGRSSFIGNVEYGGSFDFSTLCKKRRLLTGTFTAIQRALPNTALTANEILDIRNRMKKAGLEVSCGLCYVEGSRANMGQFAQEFLKLYRQYYPDAWQPNMADVNTPEGIEWVRINHPECYEQYEYFWNHYGTLKPGDKNLFASQQKPKLYQLHTEYNGEILQKFKNDDNVEDKNLNGGIRLQSFSDFEIVHLIDTMQIIMDMSRVGLAGQAYTKVPDFAWALGDTGLKINLSLIAKDVDAEGKLIFDDIEGMPIGEAMRLRDRYSANVGTILVAFNDAQLMAAMADDRVDFIIPFHRSQWKKSQYEAMGLPAKTKDYTYMQNEKFINPQYHEYRGRMVRDKATNYMPNEYWDFSKTGKENAETYLQMCARNNKRPKFYKLLQNNGDGSYSLKADGSTDGYWKLLIDFKMYDNDGNGSPQTPVRPEFNMDEATRMLNDYRGGHSNFPVAQGIVDEFVSEHKESHGDRQYQDRAAAPITNRALLANALESTTQDETELTRLREYRMSIDYLNEQEAKLTELRSQIREISFGKGPRDTVRLKQLQEEATKTATRINEADKKLLRLEAAKPLQRVLERERGKAYRQAQNRDKEVLARRQEGRNRTALKKKIQGTIRELDKIFSKGTKQRNVKQGMRDFVATALKSAEALFADNYSNEDMVRSGVGVDLTAEEARLLHETQQLLTERDQLYSEDAISQEVELTVSGDLKSYEQRMTRSVELDRQILRNMGKLKGVFERERNRLNSATVTELLNNLAAEYRNLGSSDDMYIRAVTNEDVYQHLLALAQNTGGTLVKDMSQEQLLTLHKAYKMVLSTIRNANKAFVDGRPIEAEANQLVVEMQAVKVPSGKIAVALRNLNNSIGWNYEKLYYALDRINSPTLTRLFGKLSESENITMQDVREAKAFQMEMIEKYHYNDWDVEKRMDHVFVDNTGKKFRLTLGQVMSLYAYSRRENTDKHLEYGGFKIGKAALTDAAPATTYKLTPDQVKSVTNILTPEQRLFAEAMQKYLSETMGAKGNEVSMKLYGIEMFGEENYFPLHIAGEYKARAQESQAKEQAGFQSMSNAGFTKARNQNATAPVVLEDFLGVWVDHVNEMSRYHGAVPALEDIRRVMNYSVYSDAMNDSVSVRAAMENAFGNKAVEYFDNLYREANSGAISDKMDAVPKKLLSLFRKNAVAYSLSVVIQQPASIYRARSLVDRKYFGVHGLFTITRGSLRILNKKKWNASYNEMLKYAPGVTMAKEIGGFDTSTGSSIRSYLMDTEKGFFQSMKHDTLAKKANTVLGVVDDNVIANLPEVADKIAWIEMWEAVKRETVAKNKNLSAGSEAFYKKVGERFTEVIRATQVYDSMFSKSPMLKSKNLLVQTMVSFMNEPNTVANMAESAIRNLSRGNYGLAAKTAAALTVSIVITNVLKSLVYAMRDKDEDEMFIEKYISAIAGNLMNDINPLNYIPFVRDGVSVFQGYDVERADMAIIGDAANAIIKLAQLSNKDVTDMTDEELKEWEMDCIEAKWQVAETLSPLLGIPLKNIRRDFMAIINTVNISQLDSTRTATELSIRHMIQDAVFTNRISSGKSDSDKLYEAIVSGDTTYAERLRDTYKTDDAYHSSIRKALRTHDPRIQQAANAYVAGDFLEYDRLKTEISGEGMFEYMDVDSAIKAEIRELEAKSGDAEKTTAEKKPAPRFTAEEYYVSLRDGNKNAADTIYDYLYQSEIDQGYLRHQAASNVQSQLASQVKKAYMDGEISRNDAIKMLQDYGGKGETDVKQWDFELETGYAWGARTRGYYLGDISREELKAAVMDIENESVEDANEYLRFLDLAKGNEDIKITASQAKAYFEHGEPAGIQVGMWIDYQERTDGIKNDLDEDGEPIRFSAMKKKMEIINSLPISSEQKTAIAVSEGWSEKNIRRYKLW